MKETTELVKETLEVITPYLVTGGKEILNEAAKDLWVKIKSIFKSRGDENITDQIEITPDDAGLRGKMEYILESELKNNQELVTMFSQLLDKVTSSSEHKSLVIQSGNDNISIGGQIKNSSIKIKK